MPEEAKETTRRDYADLASELGAALQGGGQEEPESQEAEPQPTAAPQPEPEEVKAEPETPKEAPKPVDAEDQAERTKLGRRVKKLEDLITDLVTELRESRKPEKIPEPLPEVVSTPQDVLRIMSAAEEDKRKQLHDYQLKYRKAIEALGAQNEDVHKDVLAEILAPGSKFNEILSADPFADAERNYYRAANQAMKKKVQAPVQPKPNVRGEKPIAPAGIPTGSPTPPPPKKAVKVDEFSRSFMKRMGLSDDWAEKALQE